MTNEKQEKSIPVPTQEPVRPAQEKEFSTSWIPSTLLFDFIKAYQKSPDALKSTISTLLKS